MGLMGLRSGCGLGWFLLDAPAPSQLLEKQLLNSGARARGQLDLCFCPHVFSTPVTRALW